MAVRCEAIARSGRPCSAPPVAGSTWCYIHDPAGAEARRESSRRGGFARSNKERARAALPDPLDPADVQRILGAALRDVLNGGIEPGVATAAAGVARALLAAREATALEDRIQELEAIAGIGDERRSA